MVFAYGTMTRRLDPERQPEDLDEANGRGVIEGIALVVGGQIPVVQGKWGLSTRHHGGSVIQPHPDIARYDPLGGSDVAAEVSMECREPQSVIRQLRMFVGDQAIESERVLGQGQALERPMRLSGSRQPIRRPDPNPQLARLHPRK